MIDQMPSIVISSQHAGQLEAIAAELEQDDLEPARRNELISQSSEIADHYSCDSRFCD